MRPIISVALFMCSLACSHEHEHAGHTFDNLPDCVDDHASLGEIMSITHCLVDFPDLHPDFANLQECIDWVADNGGYADSRDAACEEYFVEIGA